MTRRTWTRVRLLGGAAILVVLLVRLGVGPFARGLGAVQPWSAGAAICIAVLTTVCSAWRWQLVTHGNGGDLGLVAAVASYYRSQLLNIVVPGGVVGDVQRGLRHGVADVVVERVSGQVVQVLLAAVALLVLPSPVDPAVAVAAAVVAVLVGAVLVRARPAAWTLVTIASVGAVVGHVALFLVAARAVGTPASYGVLVPLALLVLLAMAVPLNVAGWGPREGVAAWAFAAVGLGAAQGVEVAVAYGVLSLVSVLPGAALLLLPTSRAVREPSRVAVTDDA